MNTYYYDMSEYYNKNSVRFFPDYLKIIYCGTTLSVMPASIRYGDDEAEYKEYSSKYNLNFIFEDNVPLIEFYTVPWFDIFAYDNNGGYFCALEGFIQDETISIYYIDKDLKGYYICTGFDKFLSLIKSNEWKGKMRMQANAKVSVPVIYTNCCKSGGITYAI